MASRNYVYFQPNKKDLRDRYGDCQIRALCKVLDLSWLEVYDLMVSACRKEQIYTISSCPVDVRNRVMDSFGFKYIGISNKKGSKRPTVKQFAKQHPVGRYVCKVSNHVVACVDGKFYDTWDSGECCLYGYYEKTSEF